MVGSCIDCVNLLYDGFTYCCFNKDCPHWSDDMISIKYDSDPIPDYDLYTEGDLEDDLFI